MKIALCFPRTIEDLRSLDAPLGISSLGTVLKREMHIVRLFDSSFNKSLNNMLRGLKEFNPDVVGVSVLSCCLNNAKIVTKFAKKVLNAITIMGGPHPTVALDRLSDFEYVDYLVFGEGEASLLELINFLEKKHKSIHQILGIGYKIDGRLKRNEPRDFIENLIISLRGANSAYIKNMSLSLIRQGRNQVKRK